MTSEQCTKWQSGPLNSERKDRQALWIVHKKTVRPSEQCTKRQHVKFIPILYYNINRFKYVWYDDLVICNYIWKKYHEQLCYIASLSTMAFEQCTKRQSGPLNSVRQDSQTLWTAYEETTYMEIFNHTIL